MSKSVVLSLSLAAASSASALFNSTDTHRELWNQFVKDFDKKYSSSAEEYVRFKTFVDNLRVIDERNALEGKQIHGITRFADLSQEEFRMGYLGSKSSPKENRKILDQVHHDGSTTSVDWSGVFTTPVKDQGYCGSCWAFSATEQLESDSMRVLGTNYILSVAQTTQCTDYLIGGGCGGGFTESAYHYIKTSGGLVQDSDYPYSKKTYEGVTGECTVDTSEDVIGLTGFTTITGETNMANYMLSTGPLSVCVAAEVWNTYTGGILTSCPGGVDHCVQAVGVDTGINGYWKVRNSWGDRWGEEGYIRISYGSNTCKINDDPTFVDPIISKRL